MLKKISLLFVFMAVVLTGCGQAETGYQGESALQVLEDVWGAYGDDEKFAIVGGASDQIVMDAPGKLDVTNAEALASVSIVSSEAAVMVEDGASIVHMMNANTFTAAAFRLSDGKQMDAFAEQIKDSCKNHQWMCGFPEQLLVAGVGEDYVVITFGNADLIETWKTHLTEVTGSEILIEESLI